MRIILILISVLSLQFAAHAQGMSLSITVGGEDYGDYNFSPFVANDLTGSSSGTPYGPPGGNGGGFQRAQQPSPDMQLYAPEDHPSVVAYRNRVQEEGRRHAAQIHAKVTEIQAEIQKIITSSHIHQAVIKRKYRDLYVKQGSLARKDINYLVEKNSIRGVIRPQELSIENQDDGLNLYRDQIYEKNSTLTERKITRINNFHNYAFREARWDNLQRMKRGDDLAIFESVEHFQAAELLSRTNIYYSNRFLNKDNPSKEDMRIGHSLLDDAKSVGDFAMGVGSGVKTTVVETVKGIPILVKKTYSAIKNYEQTIDQVNRLIEQFDGHKFASAVGGFFKHKWDEFVEGDAHKKGEMIGSLTTEIASMFIPGTAAVKLTAKAAKYSKVAASAISGTRMGRGLISLGNKVGNVSGDILDTYIKTSRRIIQNEVGAVGYLDDLATHTPKQQFINTGEFLQNSTKLSKNAEEYLLRQSVGTETMLGKGNIFSADDLDRIATRYNEMEKAFEKGLPSTIYEGPVYRAASERYMKIDDLLPANGLTEAEEVKNVFFWHDKIKTSNGRYGLGGPQGQEVLYTSIGPKERAFETIMEEFKDSVNRETGRLIVDEPLRLVSKEVKVNKVLDLISPDVRRQLGIDFNDIIIKHKEDPLRAYEIPQQISHLAHKNGFNAIMVPSAENLKNGGVNLDILNKKALVP